MKTILAIDEGTTGTRALLMNERLETVASNAEEFPQHFPEPGWVEHDLNEIWAAVARTISRTVLGQDANSIAAIGITNQRETICFWDRKTVEPLARAIVWQDRRTAGFCDELKNAGHEKLFQERTGLLLDPYFAGTKAAWALKHWAPVEQAARAGRLAIGTIDSFLVAKLTGGRAHVTEPSNASRTLAFGLESLKWDPELCRELGVNPELWPEVKPSTGNFGVTHGLGFLPDGIPITGILGDQQSALLGQACLEAGQAKCTYGTGAFLLMNTGAKIKRSSHRMLTTVAWQWADGSATYALEGSAFIAGAAVQWVRDSLGLIERSADIEGLAAQVSSSDGAVFVPALTGLGAPHWNAQATGMFTGLTRGTTRSHLARAVLDGIAFQIADILAAMEKDLGAPLKGLNVDGGASANNLLMQFQSDILGVPTRRPKMIETTALGAVFAAGLGAGVWSSPSDVKKSWQIDREFAPRLSAAERAGEMKRWHKAVARVNL